MANRARPRHAQASRRKAMSRSAGTGVDQTDGAGETVLRHSGDARLHSAGVRSAFTATIPGVVTAPGAGVNCATGRGRRHRIDSGGDVTSGRTYLLAAAPCRALAARAPDRRRAAGPERCARPACRRCRSGLAATNAHQRSVRCRGQARRGRSAYGETTHINGDHAPTRPGAKSSTPPPRPRRRDAAIGQVIQPQSLSPGTDQCNLRRRDERGMGGEPGTQARATSPS